MAQRVIHPPGYWCSYASSSLFSLPFLVSRFSFHGRPPSFKTLRFAVSLDSRPRSPSLNSPPHFSIQGFSSIFHVKSLEASRRGRERRLVTFSSRLLCSPLLLYPYSDTDALLILSLILFAAISPFFISGTAC